MKVKLGIILLIMSVSMAFVGLMYNPNSYSYKFYDSKQMNEVEHCEIVQGTVKLKMLNGDVINAVCGESGCACFKILKEK